MGHQPRASPVQAMVLGTTEFPRKAVGRGFSAQEAVSLQTHRGTQNWGSETELGFRERAGEGHCSIPNTPRTPEGPLPFLEKGEATLGFRFGCGGEYSVPANRLDGVGRMSTGLILGERKHLDCCV